MPNEWGFLDDNEDDDNSIESMNFDNFNSDFLDDDEDDNNSNTHSIDDDLFGEEDTSLPSTNNTIGNAQVQHVDQQNLTPASATAQDDDGIAFGIIDPQDNMNVTRGQADLEDGVTVDDDGMLDFSDSLVDEGSQPQPYGDQSYDGNSTTSQSYNDALTQSNHESPNVGQQSQRMTPQVQMGFMMRLVMEASLQIRGRSHTINLILMGTNLIMPATVSLSMIRTHLTRRLIIIPLH